MDKLEAWKAWSATAGTDGSEFTLEKSSHGKAFSYAWDAATAVEREAIAQMIEDAPTLMADVRNNEGGCLICGFTPRLAATAIRARSNTCE